MPFDGIRVIFMDLDFFFLQKIERHPAFSLRLKKNDIALIQFDGTVEFSEFIRPACIRTDTTDLSSSQELTIAGWGTVTAGSKNIISINRVVRELSSVFHKPSNCSFSLFFAVFSISIARGLGPSTYSKQSQCIHGAARHLQSYAHRA